MRIDWKDLYAAAEGARRRAYAPYSNFKVGVAVLATDGTLHVGCNLENAAYPLAVCAERNALARMVVEGKQPAAIAIVVDSKTPTPPCGGCRQVLNELCSKDTPVRSRNLKGDEAKWTVGKLLPFAFGPENL